MKYINKIKDYFHFNYKKDNLEVIPEGSALQPDDATIQASNTGNDSIAQPNKKAKRKERPKKHEPFEQEVKEFVKNSNVIDSIQKLSDEKLLSESREQEKSLNSKDADKTHPIQRAKQQKVLELQKEELQKRGISEKIERQESHDKDIANRLENEQSFAARELEKRDKEIERTGRFEI
jgi:hypothetical protein